LQLQTSAGTAHDHLFREINLLHRAGAREDYQQARDGFQRARGYRGRNGGTTQRLDGARAQTCTLLRSQRSLANVASAARSRRQLVADAAEQGGAWCRLQIGGSVAFNTALVLPHLDKFRATPQSAYKSFAAVWLED